MELDEKYIDVIVKRYIRSFENIDDSFYRIREGKRTDLVDITEYFE